MWFSAYGVGTDSVMMIGLRRLVDERIMVRACRFCSVTRLWSRMLDGNRGGILWARENRRGR